MTMVFRILLLLGALALLAGTAGEVCAVDLTEHEVKAAFLYNFAKFVTWPESALPEGDSPLEIGVVGDETFAEALEMTVRGKTAAGHPIRVVRFEKISDLRNCPILYFDEGGIGLETAALFFDEPAVLTVGDLEGFAPRGGVIGFFMEQKRVKFEVNTTAAKNSGLRISSQLLDLARIVRENDR